ncbi:hypothetical protein QE152_g21898 [Popillia japonica]|uniref:Uncharacterized protein n=1 Tax=Popillia japonica TaxID=7064 RepID=A0AAW1KKG9_POPJA
MQFRLTYEEKQEYSRNMLAAESDSDESESEAYPEAELTNYLPPNKNFDSDAENTEETYNVEVNRKIDSDSDEIDSDETAMTILVAKMKRIHIRALILFLVNVLIILFVAHLCWGLNK